MIASTKKQIVAAFDFDGTLTTRESTLSFLLYCAGPLQTLFNLLLETPLFIQYLFKKASRQQVKEALLTRFFKNKKKATLNKWGAQFSKQKIPRFLKKEALNRLIWHQSQGHTCVLISASLDTYLNPWGKAMGFDHIITSQLEFSSSEKVTGKLLGPNCRSQEKVNRLIQQLGPLQTYTLYAYGDSQGDQELLASADFPYYRTFS